MFKVGEQNCNWNGGISQYPNHSKMKKVRKVILEKSKFTCYYCGKPANEIHHKDLSKHNHSEDNIVASCHSCNLRRHKDGTSKFKRMFGKTLSQIASDLNFSESYICRMHKIGILNSILQPEEIKAILF